MAARPPSTPRIGLVHNGVWSHWAFVTAPKYRSRYRPDLRSMRGWSSAIRAATS